MRAQQRGHFGDAPYRNPGNYGDTFVPGPSGHAYNPEPAGRDYPQSYEGRSLAYPTEAGAMGFFGESSSTSSLSASLATPTVSPLAWAVVLGGAVVLWWLMKDSWAVDRDSESFELANPSDLPVEQEYLDASRNFHSYLHGGSTEAKCKKNPRRKKNPKVEEPKFYVMLYGNIEHGCDFRGECFEYMKKAPEFSHIKRSEYSKYIQPSSNRMESGN